MEKFFSKVYEIVSKIPVGKVITYGQIAMLLGKPKGARAVGWAMRAVNSNANLPCHRVVNRLGEMSPNYVFGSSELQRAILESEGITFLKNGCIDMKKHMWSGC